MRVLLSWIGRQSTTNIISALSLLSATLLGCLTIYFNIKTDAPTPNVNSTRTEVNQTVKANTVQQTFGDHSNINNN